MLVVCTESTYECIFYCTHRDNCWIQNKFKITILYSINEHTQPALYAIRNYIIVGRMLVPIYVNRCVTGGGKGDSFWQNRRHRRAAAARARRPHYYLPSHHPRDPCFDQSLGFSGNFRLKIRKFQTEIILFLLLPKSERNSTALVARVYCHQSQIQFIFLFLDTCGQTCKLDTI